MAVQTGTTHTYEMGITLDYVCSQCGHRNIAEKSLRESVFTSALIRVNPYEEARKAFDGKINLLNNGPVPERYRQVGISCRCQNCGHFEPWSFAPPGSVNLKLLWIPPVIMIFAIIFFQDLPAISPILNGSSYGAALKVLLILAGTIPYFVLVIRNAIRSNKQMRAIRNLPPQSLPVVRPSMKSVNNRRFF